MSLFQVGWSPIMKNKSAVLALKYRPQTFKDLIGHEEITSTIFNSLKNKKSSNAFLFTGIRGIGKTTFARIVAKALNCERGVDNLCNDNFCTNCESIINSNHIDVLEIDAASRTGVDDVRELIEFSRYAPTVAKFKVFIIDEVHMLSKQAFNALLKTLEEPPEYLKFIFATTEVKKIPITVISRCQRYDLSRLQSEKLFDYIKNVVAKEKKKLEENAIKLIVKMSEGSVRDALSLLDRAILSNNGDLLTYKQVQNIFGYTDKGSYIDLLKSILEGNEADVIKLYREIYKTGVEANNFLNEFLEILYYAKNIDYLKSESTNFSLNENDHKKILYLSKKLNASEILLFWEFTLKTIKEINIVSNQNLSIEMFLIQLLYLHGKDLRYKKNINTENINNNINNTEDIKKNDAVDQIKNIQQAEQKTESINSKEVKNLSDLIEMCNNKKELKLKYEIENNVNLVSFLNNRIEIAFNEKLSKDFVKELSEKLFEWTDIRWIISFSKQKGEISKKDEQKNSKKKEINEFKNSKIFKELKKNFSDIDLVDLKEKHD
tara:strand:+ start:38 stop:1681 length:1644 start_codon:yes stop_codon:yes gene_type:complete